jgi:hypothetical protein
MVATLTAPAGQPHAGYASAYRPLGVASPSARGRRVDVLSAWKYCARAARQALRLCRGFLSIYKRKKIRCLITAYDGVVSRKYGLCSALFPKRSAKIIYTTNAIENLNHVIRKTTKTRGSFPTDGVRNQADLSGHPQF